MKKNHFSGILLIAILSILLFAIFVIILLYGWPYGLEVFTIVTIVDIVVGLAGIIIIRDIHFHFFGDDMRECDECLYSFDAENIKKQIDHDISGKMYVSYRCPSCNAGISI